MKPGKVFNFIMIAALFSGVYLAWVGVDKKNDRTLSDTEALGRLASFYQPFSSTAELFLYTEQQAQLGREFFFEKSFSADEDMSCATCHDPSKGFSDNLSVAKTRGDSRFNTPSLINSALSGWFFWDGRKDSLASQAHGPIENKLEHNFSSAGVYQVIRRKYLKKYEKIFGKLPSQIAVASHSIPIDIAEETKLSSIKDAPTEQTLHPLIVAYALKTLANSEVQKRILGDSYAAGLPPVDFLSTQIKNKVFPLQTPSRPHDPSLPSPDDLKVVFDHFGRAIAAFEERLLAVNSPFDRFRDRIFGQATGTAPNPTAIVSGPEDFFTEEFTREHWEGFKVFAGNGQCINCHHGFNFSDSQFHNIGLGLGSGSSAVNIIDWPWGRAIGEIRLEKDASTCLEPERSVVVDNGCLDMPWLESKNLEMLGAFKTPSLRNLSFSAPYMHDGRFSTLEEVLVFYATPMDAKVPFFGHTAEILGEVNLSPDSQRKLLKFLDALNDQVGVEKLSAQFSKSPTSTTR